MKRPSVNHTALGVLLVVALCAPATGFADFAIRQASGIDSEPTVAYNSQTHEYLVVWIKASTSGMGPLMGQRVSETGALSGSPITISVLALGGISVAYNAAQNQFLVVFVTGILPDSGINGQLLDAAGTLVGNSVQLMYLAGHPKILYNSLAGNYLLLGLKGDLYSRKIGANGQPLAAAENVTNDLSVDYSKFAAAYAPVTSSSTLTGRYLVAKYPVSLMMLDSNGKPMQTLHDPIAGWYDASIPFSTGSPSGAIYDVAIAYGDTSGYSMWGKAFFVVWSDANNKFNGQQWDGIWGGYVDATDTYYESNEPVKDNAFPISYIYHWNYSTYAKSWRPAVAFNPVARKFQVAWRETPTTSSQNDATVNHIRAHAGFFSAPPGSNVVLSATSGTEDPTNPAIAASTTGPSALVVWDDVRNQSTTEHDIYGSLYNVAGPTSNGLLVTNTKDSGPGSLRQAILDANLRLGPDSIAFAIPTTDSGYQSSKGIWKIKPATPLPDIMNDGTLINGMSQGAFAGDTNPAGPEIEIDGSLAGSSADGLRIRSFFNSVWGLTINRFNGNGIFIVGPGAGANLIIRSYIGVTPDAKAKAPNQMSGIRISQSSLNFVGFFDTLSANVVGGNTSSGIAVSGANSRFNVVLVNCIGTDLSHATNLGNGEDGISFSDSASDNAVTGYAFPMHVVVMNNGLAGIHVNGGGTVHNLLAAGCIYGNGGPGIALSSGGNNSKAAPIITDANTALIKGTAASNNMIFLYNDPGDEGKEYFATVYTDALGKFSWTGTAKGPHITAIAVDTSAGLTVNNTSGFSTPKILTGINDDGDSGQPMQFELSQNYPNPFNPLTTIGFRVAGKKNGPGVSGPGSGWVKLAVYDLLGREVALLVNEKRAPGEYSVTFDAKGLASGVYVYRLSTGSYTDARRMILVR